MPMLSVTTFSRSFLHLLAAVLLFSLFQTSNSTLNSETRGLKLKMIHIDSPHSPMYQPELTYSERIQRLASLSETRLRSHAKNTSQEHASEYRELDRKPELRQQRPSSLYYVELGLGTGNFDGGPYERIALIFDTGSDFTWTQCEGCRECFYQTKPKFRKSKSSTFTRDLCNQCRRGQCKQNHCTESKTYADGTSVVGFWAMDRLTFPSSFFNDDYKDGFFFLCGMEIANFVAARQARTNNGISGILGMGRGKYSLMGQLEADGVYDFSHCLQRPTDILNNPSILRLGDTNAIRVPHMSVTTLYTNENNPFYYLSLEDISVDDEPLNIPEHLFVLNPDGSGGTMIDSGSELTYLVWPAYSILLTEFMFYMRSNNPSSRKYPHSLRDTGRSDCWVPGPNFQIPTLTFHFQDDADLVIKPAEVMIKFPLRNIPDPGYLYCLTTNPTDHDVNVIGACHQVNQQIIYDLKYSKLSFVGFDCSRAR